MKKTTRELLMKIDELQDELNEIKALNKEKDRDIIELQKQIYDGKQGFLAPLKDGRWVDQDGNIQTCVEALETQENMDCITIHIGLLLRKKFRIELGNMKFLGHNIEWIENKTFFGFGSDFCIKGPQSSIKIIDTMVRIWKNWENQLQQ
jgi:hypothetical protein